MTEPNPSPKTFVLVHGAWHGGWCWARVAERLAAKGHKVLTPTLTGLGERSHLMSPDIDLDTHVTDIVNVIRWERLENVVLCGHSYAGWVISGVAEQVEAQLSAIVYLDAFVPEDGESGLGLSAGSRRESLDRAIANGDVSRPAPPASGFGVNEADQPWVDALMTPQPVGVSLKPIRLNGARERVASKAYVVATGKPSPQFVAYHEALKSDPTWRLFEAPCGHDVMIDMPDLLTDILLEVA
ncbi:MAG: alpha/beta hydrolase [Alphaproteobacteria bacterium]